MKIEINKTYLTKQGRFVKMVSMAWTGVFNGEYEEDRRGWDMSPRYIEDGKAWDVFFTMGGVYFPEHDIIMEDSAEARKLAQEMKLKRKRKAYKETN
jgi:hypothetical protein